LAGQNEDELPVLEGLDVDEILLSCENQTNNSKNTPASQDLCQSDQIDQFHSYCLEPDATNTNIYHNSTNLTTSNIPIQTTNPPYFQEYENPAIRPQSEDLDIYINDNSSTQPLVPEGECLKYWAASQNNDIHVTADHSGVFDIALCGQNSVEGGQVITLADDQVMKEDGGKVMTVENGQVMTVASDQLMKVDGGQVMTMDGSQVMTVDGGKVMKEDGGQVLTVNGFLCRATGSGGYVNLGEGVDHSDRVKTCNRKRKRDVEDNEALLPVLEEENKRLKVEEELLRKKVEGLKSAYMRAITNGKLVFYG